MDKKSIAIMIAVAVVFGGAGFYGGAMYEKKALASVRQNRTETMAGNFSGRSNNNDMAGSGGQVKNGARNGAGRGFVSGSVIAKDDKSITVKGQDGSSKIILFSGETSVGKTVDGSSGDLSTGQNVIVSGTTNSDGSVTAENIQIRPDIPQGQGNGGVPTNTPATSETN